MAAFVDSIVYLGHGGLFRTLALRVADIAGFMCRGNGSRIRTFAIGRSFRPRLPLRLERLLSRRRGAFTALSRLITAALAL